MSYIATMSSVGQITLPKDVREKMGIGPGSKLKLDLDSGRLIIERQKTLPEALAEIDRLREEELKENPEFAKRYKKYAGMTASEMKDSWAQSKEGKQYYKEKYGV